MQNYVYKQNTQMGKAGRVQRSHGNKELLPRPLQCQRIGSTTSVFAHIQPELIFQQLYMKTIRDKKLTPFKNTTLKKERLENNAPLNKKH